MMNNDKFIEIKVYVTTNYDQFLLLPENRPVKGNIVGKSIKKKNLLLDNPILVTPLMQVLDGQHRLDFARDNKLPIYYKIAQVTSREDISLLQNHISWRLSEHQGFYAGKGSPDYLFIQDMAKKYELSIYFVIGCCDPNKGSGERFKNGETVIKAEKSLLAQKFAEMYELIQIAKSILETCDNKNRSITHKFNQSLWLFIHREDYSHERLVHAFKAHPKNLIDILTINSMTLIQEALEKKMFKYCTRHK